MRAPDVVLRLVEAFHDNIDDYKKGRFTETDVRVQYLNPLFDALGWDVSNQKKRAEAYKDVVHEDAIKVGERTKAPDYCFRIGGTRKFFLEAKKPSVNIRDDIHPVYQLKRYAWSAKLPLSILSDFEEFSVYDCRNRPKQGEKSGVGRFRYFTYEEYEDNWEEIEGVFSREAVLRGAFDRFVQSNRAKRGTMEVDDAFLGEIEIWREVLARNIALRNSGLSERQLNQVVQATIDRIIFLRICEDRGIEPYGNLRSLAKGGNVYGRLFSMFQDADVRYNSGLFHFEFERGRDDEDIDNISPALIVDDEKLRPIFKSLYFPDCPYEFSVLPADILGHIYERFLGKTITLTENHRAKVEDKPEVRKAKGVYYTPTYIVDNIVEETVGTLLEGKTPEEASEIRILDPACGSGSFLLGAFRYLMEWHLAYYAAQAGSWSVGTAATIYQGENGWELTVEERKRILLNNLFGVDIDPQAVEVTKLSLLLKVLEDEDTDTLSTYTRRKKRVLPALEDNVKCGNSLIDYGSFYEGTLFSQMPKKDQFRINMFDWKKSYPAIMKHGGFDAVIGNPPYIRIQQMKQWAPLEVEFYKKKYASAGKGNYDIYVVFVEKGLDLLRSGGKLGYILPHKFFNAQYGESLRKCISDGGNLTKVVHFSDQQIFKDASTYTCLMYLNKDKAESFEFHKVRDLWSWREDKTDISGVISAQKVTSSEWNFVVGRGASLYEKLCLSPNKLCDIADRIYQGVITSADPVFLFKEFVNKKKTTRVFSKALDEWISINPGVLKNVVRSSDVTRYSAVPSAKLLFPYNLSKVPVELIGRTAFKNDYNKAWEYLVVNKKSLEKREDNSFADSQWYRFGRSQNLGLWEQKKILVPYMITRLTAALDMDNLYYVNVTTGGYGLTLKRRSGVSYEYVCGLMNSKLLDFYLKIVSTNFQGGYFAANKQYIEQLPIRVIDYENPADVARHDAMVSHVQTMLELHKDHTAAGDSHEKVVLRRQIDGLDREIDRLVYDLYDLTEKEIAIVESDVQ